MRTIYAILAILAVGFVTVGCGNADNEAAQVKTSKTGDINDQKHGATGKAETADTVSTD